MLWLWIVLISLFCNAAATVLDKFLLTKSFPRPAVLTFWTAIWNLLGIVFVFWNFTIFPGWRLLILALLSGVVFTIALQFFYVAMKTGEASHISPLTGGMVAVTSMVVSYFWLGERLAFNQVTAVILLVIGVFIISFEKSRKHNGWHWGMLSALIAGIFFGLAYVFARAVYLEESFSTGFVWGRIGCAAAALPLLLSAKVRKDIFAKEKKEKNKEKKGLLILAVNKSLASVYYVGMQFAVSLASATLVNALAGLQYAVLLIMIYILTKALPKFFREQFTKAEIFQECLAIALIVAGLGLMVI